LAIDHSSLGNRIADKVEGKSFSITTNVLHREKNGRKFRFLMGAQWENTVKTWGGEKKRKKKSLTS